ncbi:ABC-F type ribosomal protection protein [Paenibacillus albiflavus]|uniref:ABC-F type ribosomal protection protein n=1 Tax=Paenibacillus albiflavus TaxID=2545760 RepID=A0A4R4ELM3_9BACL|nr:ABC-F type ribosomal protection protein [Paenibacillus albiflavus]TCZ80919.1 ABC-F type ribosomal protection protein [Paenibacillus albiflavus]
MIVSMQQVHKYYGANLVLSDLTLEVNDEDKIGLIGRNGTGKTTILQLIAGMDKQDQGDIAIRKMTKIGYLEQTAERSEQTTVYEVLSEAYGEVRDIQRRMVVMEASMSDEQVFADESKLNQVLAKYAELQEQFEQAGGYEMEARINQIASGLSVPTDHYQRLFASLSGGEKTRVGLASILLANPNLLLLDEPTNHLDVSAVEWLENYLRNYKGSYVIVSHDRYFLDQVVNKIVEVEDGEASIYHTNYSGYQQEKQERLLKQFSDYQDQQKQIKQMKEAIKRYQEWGKIGGNDKFFRRAAAIQKAIDRMEKIKRPILQRKTAEFEFNLGDRSGEDVVTLLEVEKSYGDRLLLTDASQLLRYGERVAIIGDNGTGKSTLFKLILGQEKPDEGEVMLGSRVQVGYLAQDSKPQVNQTVLQYFREEAGLEEGTARGRLAQYLFYGADVFKGICNLSGGEWTRLRLALIMHAKPNLLMLDEPTNHLDIESREALEEMLEDYSGTVLAISHDRYFINKLAQQIWQIKDRKLLSHIGNFDDLREKETKKS